MIYWKRYDDYTVIANDDLDELCNEFNVRKVTSNQGDKETRDWFNYAVVIARKNNFNVVYEACFVYYVTLFFADEGISAGAEEEYFMKKLDTHIFDLYYAAREEMDVEESQKRFFFNKLVELFGGDKIKQYERKIFSHNVQVSSEIKEWFDGFSTIRSAIVSLLYHKIEKPHLDMNRCVPVVYIGFMLTYSEETVWRSLSSISDGDRLRVLLF